MKKTSHHNGKEKIAFFTAVFPANKQYIDEFLDSLKKQTYTDFDVVVVNDGLKEFNEIKIKYKNYFNIIDLSYSSTPAKNREYGINYCIENRYDILIFGDSDDYFSENRIEKSVQYLRLYDIVVNDVSLFDMSGIVEKKYISNRLNNNHIVEYDYIKDKNIFGLSNTAIKLSGMSKIKIENDLVAIDWHIFKNLLKGGKVAIFSNEMITYYRQYDNNTVGLKVENGKYILWWENRQESKAVGVK